MSIFVNTIPRVQEAIEELLAEDEVAVGVEGIHLCREGSISIIQVCPQSKMPEHVAYLFDITTLKEDAFAHGLQALFGSHAVRKVMFDGRSACDALYHLFGVVVSNIYSLQVLHLFKFPPQTRKDDYCVSLRHCLDLANVVRDRTGQEAIIRRGKNLYAPEKGGSYRVWDIRPLHRDLVQYCVASVKYLLPLHCAWRDRSLDRIVEQRGRERIEAAIHSSAAAKGHQLSRRDFSLNGDRDTALAPAIPTECAICMEPLSEGWKASVEVRCLPCSHCFHVKCINGYVRREHARIWETEGAPVDYINYIMSYNQGEQDMRVEEPVGFARWLENAQRCEVKCPLCHKSFPAGRALAVDRAKVDAVTEPSRVWCARDENAPSRSRCIQCGVTKVADAFSNNQLKRSPTLRRCKACVAGSS